MKPLLFSLALIVAFVCAIPTPAKACNAVALAPAAQSVCQSAVQLQAVYAPAVLLAAPLVVQSQLSVQAVQSYQPSVAFAAQSDPYSSGYSVRLASARRQISASIAAAEFRAGVQEGGASYGLDATAFNVGRRARLRGSRLRGRGLGAGLGLGLGAALLPQSVSIDPVAGLPVEVVDPLLLGGRGGRGGRARSRRK
jgi:hypothetical protein